MESETNWTKGPPHRDGHPRIVDQRGDEVLRVNGLREDVADVLAKALAAPEMLEALRELMADHGPDIERILRTRSLARAAIKAATGGEP